MTEGKNRAQVGRWILLTTLWLTLFIVSVKVSAAWATRSLSLFAESLQTLLVSFSTLLSLLKLTKTNQPKSLSLYGHGKRESVFTFLFIAFLGFAGWSLLGISAQQWVAITQAETLFSVRVSLPVLQLLGVVVGASLSLAILSLYQGKVHNNPTLRFQGSQLLRDGCLTLLVMGGLWGVQRGWVWLDVVFAILLLLLAAGNCWQVVSWQLPLLVQQTAIAPEAISQIAFQVQGVTYCDQIQSRGIVGRFVQIQMHLVVHPEFVSMTSQIAARIEQKIQERYGSVQVIFYIDEQLTKLASRNNSSLSSEVNGKNDPIGRE